MFKTRGAENKAKPVAHAIYSCQMRRLLVCAAKVDGSDVERRKFEDIRNNVIQIGIDNGGDVNRKMVAAADVMNYQTQAMHHKRHGRCMTVKRYAKVHGKPPPKDQVVSRYTSNGSLQQYVKVYKDMSDSEWSRGLCCAARESRSSKLLQQIRSSHHVIYKTVPVCELDSIMYVAIPSFPRLLSPIGPLTPAPHTPPPSHPTPAAVPTVGPFTVCSLLPFRLRPPPPHNTTAATGHPRAPLRRLMRPEVVFRVCVALASEASPSRRPTSCQSERRSMMARTRSRAVR